MRIMVRGLVCALVVAACATGPEETAADWAPVSVTRGGLASFAWTDGARLVVNTAGGERSFVAGVNLGPTIPGRFPGEQAIPREAFRRWFPQMRDLGMSVIRVYTIMPPAFYEELRAFNLENPSAPLLLAHGVWVPEDELAASHLFDARVVDGFRAEIADAVDVVHGQAVLPDRPGHAAGTYTADVSEWMMSWVIGIEWDPPMVEHSNTVNAGVAAHRGRFFENQGDPSPTEVWLARMLDFLATREAELGVSVPLAFVNWPTTDPLVHPDEPLESEDLVGVDANAIAATAEWPGGYFASYHAYPYYPDFQRYETGIADFEHQGRLDAYAGYLTKLREHHREIPVAITEFGVPSGLAHAHFGPQGRDQGGHSEQEQMAINAELLDVIREVGLAGGFVFEWADEWFKHTWNTLDFELPWERRALWNNVWTNEAHFGVLAVEAGSANVVVIDGDDGEWVDNGSQVILESATGVREVRAVKDEAFLYLRIRLDDDEPWRQEPVVIGLDVLTGGGGGLPGTAGADPAADYAVVLGPTEAEAMVVVRASNDPYGILYDWRRGYADVDPADFEEGSGVWNVQRLVVNRPLVVPSTGKSFPAEFIESGRLFFGSSDPTRDDFDSRATWNAAGSVIEIRLPYQAIGFADPSSLQAYRIDSEGLISTEPVARIGITVAHAGALQETTGYAWDPWHTPAWHERLKAGVAVLEDAFRRAR